ncbi:TPA: fimbrial protein [Escherichia coli]|nr:fimbrial protein [Escherichia coli]
MKKLMIASAIAMTMAAGSAMASQGEIQFFGNVTAQTCDLVPEIGGAVNNMIQLGTVTTNSGSGTTHQGQAIEFTLKAKDAGACTDAAQLGATIAWDGNLGAQGVVNQGGQAADAHVVLLAKNATTVNTPITSAKNFAEFTKDKLAGEGYKFSAQLIGGATPGDFQSASAYAVTYK